MDALRPGALVAGRYRIVRLLGQGANKQVYLADDTAQVRSVAIGVLVSGTGGSAAHAARFSRECRAASVLRSPFVVRVYDVGRLADGSRFLAMEAVLGRGLDDAMADGAPIPPWLAVRWTCHVLAALEEAHSRNILHRDVKPENVLLAPSSQGELAKLTDFGLAKVLDEHLESTLPFATAHNIVVGTPEYMPPEQWAGDSVDGRADVYATGVMLYEMLTARLPFAGNTMLALMEAHTRHDVPAFPEGLEPEAYALETVVARALSKKPSERFPSAAEFRRVLEKLTGESLPTLSLEHSDDPAPWTRVELLCEAWEGPRTLIVSPEVLFGRGREVHIRTLCLPSSEDNDARTRTLSRQHAKLYWNNGKPLLCDLGSHTGTTVRGRRIDAELYPLRNGEEFQLGHYVRFCFEHAPSEGHKQPAWARLTRTDPYGQGLTYVQVFGEASLSAMPKDALVLSPRSRGPETLRFRVARGGLELWNPETQCASVLRQGLKLQYGGYELSVAVSKASGT